MASTYTPTAGIAVITPPTGGTPVNALAAGISGGYITNPLSSVDQGITSAESLFVDPVGPASLHANDTTVELIPGQSWYAIPNSVNPVSVASATGNHKFTAVQWT